MNTESLAGKLYKFAHKGDCEGIVQIYERLKKVYQSLPYSDRDHQRTIDLNWAFSGACEQGHLKCAQVLHHMGATNLSEGFKLACENDHSTLVTWIYAEASKEAHANSCSAVIPGWDDCLPTRVNEILDFDWALFAAAQGGYIDRVKWLVKLGAQMFDQPAYIAASNNHLSVVRYLRKCGATNISQCFAVACLRGHVEIASEMMNAGVVDIHTGFLQACTHGHVEIIQMCLRTHTIPWLIGALRAQLSGHEKIVSLLMNYGQSLSTGGWKLIDVGC